MLMNIIQWQSRLIIPFKLNGRDFTRGSNDVISVLLPRLNSPIYGAAVVGVWELCVMPHLFHASPHLGTSLRASVSPTHNLGRVLGLSIHSHGVWGVTVHFTPTGGGSELRACLGSLCLGHLLIHSSTRPPFKPFLSQPKT